MQKLFKRMGKYLLIMLFLAQGSLMGLSSAAAKAVPCCCGPDELEGLSLVKSINQDNPQPGDTFSYILTYKNTGTKDATGVIISDTLAHAGQEYLTYVSGADTWDAGIKTVSFKVGTVQAGTSGKVSFKVLLGNVPEGITEIKNQAFIASNESLPKALGSNCLTTIIDFTPKVKLEIKKISSASTVAPNGEIAYEITVKNIGNKDATNLTLVDKWTEQAPGLSNYVVGSVDPAGVVDEPNKTITWTIAQLKIGQSQTFKYQLHVVRTFSPVGTYKIINQACLKAEELCSDEVIVKVRYISGGHKEEPKKPEEPQVLGTTTETLPTGGGDVLFIESLLAAFGLLIISAFIVQYLPKTK